MDFLTLENEMNSNMGPYSRRTGTSNALIYYSKYQ
jgi:hypothetical protein